MEWQYRTLAQLLHLGRAGIGHFLDLAPLPRLPAAIHRRSRRPRLQPPHLHPDRHPRRYPPAPRLHPVALPPAQPPTSPLGPALARRGSLVRPPPILSVRPALGSRPCSGAGAPPRARRALPRGTCSLRSPKNSPVVASAQLAVSDLSETITTFVAWTSSGPAE